MNNDATPTSNYQQIKFLDPDCCYKFTYGLANCADSVQMASEKPNDLDLHCLQRQDIPGFSRTRVKIIDATYLK